MREPPERGTLMGFPRMPLIDFAIMMGVVLFCSFVVLRFGLLKMRPVIQHVQEHSQQLARQADELVRLNEDGLYDAQALEHHAREIPAPISAKLDLFQRLVASSGASSGNNAAMAGLEEARLAIWGGRLEELGRNQSDFWQELAAGLCVEPIPVAPQAPQEADPADRLLYLDQLASYRQAVWELYEVCQERKIVIHEELLHFKVDVPRVTDFSRWDIRYWRDIFESDPSSGLEKIREYVDQYVSTHSQIYVVGHTDETHTNRHNDTLSYRRALFVADVIRQHLRSKHFTEGVDFTLYPLGMGEYQLLPRKDSETSSEWWKRCRRIEILFRGSSRQAREAP